METGETSGGGWRKCWLYIGRLEGPEAIVLVSGEMITMKILVILLGVRVAACLLIPEDHQSCSGVEILNEIIAPSGPLADKGVVLYVPHKPGLPEAVLALPNFRVRSAVLVQLGSTLDATNWVQSQSVEVLGGGHLVHVVVFVDDPRPFLNEVSKDLRWNPKFLLLVNLGCDDARQILTDTAISHVQRCVLLQVLTGRLTAVVEALVYYPFSTTNKIKKLGSWKTGIRKTKTSMARTEFVQKVYMSQMTNTSTRMEVEWFVDRFPTFNGYKFLLATWQDDYPFLYPAQTGPPDNGDGVMTEMLDAMASSLNFTYHLTSESPDLQWGSIENGSWNGMLGMVHRNEKNFTVNYFGFTNERIRDFDASVSFRMEGFGIALLIPPPLPKWRSIYYPFMPQVWVAMAGTLALALLAFNFQGHIASESLSISVSETWLPLVQPILGQSLPSLPTVRWQRVFLATWIMACEILTTAYTANLISFLTLPVFPERIQTVAELAESKYRITMWDYGDFVPGALKASTDLSYQALAAKLDLYPYTSTDNNAIYRFKNGTHAFSESNSCLVIHLYLNYQVRNFYLLREQLFPVHQCWYFQKNTPWKYRFDRGLQGLVEAGLIPYYLKMKTADLMGLNYELEQKLASKERETLTALTVKHVQGVFFVWVLGLGTAFVIFLIEILVWPRFYED